MVTQEHFTQLLSLFPNDFVLSPSKKQIYMAAPSGRALVLGIDGAIKGYEFMGVLLRCFKEYEHELEIKMYSDSCTIIAYHTGYEEPLHNSCLEARGQCMVDATVEIFVKAARSGWIGELHYRKPE